MSSFGEELRRERELRQITLREVAEATKINLRYLQALEGDDFEHLPGGVFNRGFVRAYSQFIGVDPEAMVNAYLLEEQAQQGHGKAKDRGILRRGQGTDPGPRPDNQSAPRPRVSLAVWVVSLILALAIAWGLFQAFKYFNERRAGESAPQSRIEQPSPSARSIAGGAGE